MNYWILTDTHFGHEKMHDYCQRPNDFEERILKNTKNVVKEDDILIHLGDFCIGNSEMWHKKFMSSCAGKCWLIKGNHDRKSNTWYHRNGWDFVAERIEFNMFGNRVILTHKPIDDDDGEFINVHGHHHNTKHHPEDKINKRHRLVFIEHTYIPISLRWIVENHLHKN